MRLVSLPGQLARARFGRLPFPVSHRLTDHPAFSLPRLVELARRLPPADVEYNAGALPIGQDPATTPRTGLSPEETIRRIESCGSWMVLKYVEKDPEYAALLDECLGDVSALTEEIEPGMFRREAFIFVSSPGAVTPYHIDPEQNFLLQVRGTKTIRIWDPADSFVVPDVELERSLTGGHRNIRWRESFAPRATPFELAPGDGVHVPVTAPHWVQNGPSASVSFSVTFRTIASEARERAIKVNSFIRRLGLRPMPVGASALRDAVKTTTFATARRMARLVRLAIRD